MSVIYFLVALYHDLAEVWSVVLLKSCYLVGHGWNRAAVIGQSSPFDLSG